MLLGLGSETGVRNCGEALLLELGSETGFRGGVRTGRGSVLRAGVRNKGEASMAV